MKKTAQGKEETHMTELLKLPVGIENFEEIRRDNFYYVDKTKLIEQLLSQWGKANLFTRPRRFGKSLNMSMLRSFFEIGADPELFRGLYISQKSALCEKYMGQFPVFTLAVWTDGNYSYSLDISKGLSEDEWSEMIQLAL